MDLFMLLYGPFRACLKRVLGRRQRRHPSLEAFAAAAELTETKQAGTPFACSAPDEDRRRRASHSSHHCSPCWIPLLLRANSNNGPCSYPAHGPRPRPKFGPTLNYFVSCRAWAVLFFPYFGPAHQARPKCTPIVAHTITIQ
jgi:hypothetical protein